MSVNGTLEPVQTLTGSASASPYIPERMAHKLTFTGAVEAEYDGSGAVEVKIPNGGGAVTPEEVAAAVEAYMEEHPVEVTESDPTVPAWAKQPEKPTYTAAEVGALPSTTAIPKTAADIGALPDTYTAPVSSVNGQTGAVVLNAADVGALPDTTQIPAVPAALPNPNKLTFIGAVSAEYDGSAAVSVEIPEGGGVDDWKMIADITTEEEIRNVFITQDSDGNTFALTDFIVYVKALANEAGTTSVYFRFGMNPNDAHDYLFQPNGGVPGSGFRWYQVRFTLLGDRWYSTDMIGHVNTSFSCAGGYINSFNDPYSITTPAAAVVVNFMANVGVGTRIVVYGK